MKIPTDSPLPIANGKHISEDVPNDGLLNKRSLLIHDEPEILQESQQKMDDLSQSDWENLSQYRKKYNREQQAKQALAMLEVQKDDPSYGFRVNNYRHCLQSATRAYNNGENEEMIVACLLHDIGDELAPMNHSEYAAAIIKPYVSKKTHWIIEKHGEFQMFYYAHHLGGDKNKRDKYKDHKYYQDTIDFCEKYDQNSFDPEFKSLPLEFFKPIVKKIFSRKPYSVT